MRSRRIESLPSVPFPHPCAPQASHYRLSILEMLACETPPFTPLDVIWKNIKNCSLCDTLDFSHLIALIIALEPAFYDRSNVKIPTLTRDSDNKCGMMCAVDDLVSRIKPRELSLCSKRQRLRHRATTMRRNYSLVKNAD